MLSVDKMAAVGLLDGQRAVAADAGEGTSLKNLAVASTDEE